MGDKAYLKKFGPYLSGVTAMSGMQVFHYAPGSNSAKIGWTGYDKSATTSQPLDADARGLANFWGDGLYRFVVVDPNSVTLYDLDNVQVGPVQPVEIAVNKNGTDQTSVVVSTWTKVTWASEDYDAADTFASDKWIPGRVGRALCTAALVMSSVASHPSGGFLCLAFYVNSSREHIECTTPAALQSGAFGVELTAILDVTSTTDFIEVYAKQEGAGDSTIVGLATQTWFHGAMIA